jgi:hypothetical protein
MFTIKFYSTDQTKSPGGYRQKILQAESFTILRMDDGTAEITLHQKDQANDRRIDINDAPWETGFAERFESAIIENAAGKTTEMVNLRHR